MIKYIDMPFKEWDGESPLCIYGNWDEWFYDKESVEDYCFDTDTSFEDLELVIAEPVYGDIIDPNQIWEGDIPEEEELQYWWPELDQKIQEINKLIIARKESGRPWCWYPGKYRTTVNLTS